MYRLIGGKLYSSRGLKKFAIQAGFFGTGSDKNPIIIKGFNFDIEFTKLKNISEFIIFENCRFRYLNVKGCRNIKFNECVFDTMEFSNSANCIVNNAIIASVLRFRRSSHLLIQNSRISTLHLIFSRFNTFSKCTIYNGINKFSGGNIFEESIKLGSSFKSLLTIFPRRKFHENIVFYPSLLIIIIVSILIFFTLFYSNLEVFPKLLSIAFSVFFISSILYVIINEHYHYLKSFKAGNNEFK